MLQTLFHIPAEVAGAPVFGWGLLALVWGLWSVGYVAWQIKRRGWNPELPGAIGVMAAVELVLLFVTPHLLDRDPETGRALGIAIRGYGVMLLSGIVSGVALTIYRARKVGVADETVYSLALWVFVAGMVGARAFYVVEYWKSFQRESPRETLIAVLNLTQGGLVVFGGFLGAVAAILVFARKHELSLPALADLTAPGMTLGLALGRVGCFFNGCCYGDLCALPWSVEFPPNSPPFVRQIETGRAFGFLLAGLPDATRGNAKVPLVAEVEPGSPAERAGLQPDERLQAVDGRSVATIDDAHEAIVYAVRGGRLPLRLDTDRGRRTVELLPQFALHSRPVHPAQLYAAIDGLLTTLLLLAFEPLRRRDGETFALLLTVHPISRFLLEVVRVDEPDVFGTHLSISQNLSVAMLAAAVALWWRIERRPTKPAAARSAEI